MKIVRSDGSLQDRTRALLGPMLSPLCGLDQRIGFMMRTARGPRFCVAGAELSGVHLLRNRPKPREGSYHIGGSGVFLEEAVVRSLGETAERYSQLLAETTLRRRIEFASYTQLAGSGRRVLGPESYVFFTPEQLAADYFRFKAFDPDSPMAWIPMQELAGDEETLVPAQLVLVGYNLREDRGERWMGTAVTTGTAAHTDPKRALRNAILELIQIDAAMGHWYSPQTAPEIVLGARAGGLRAILDRRWPRCQQEPRFFWLKSPDLPGTAVACLIASADGGIPATSVGLGIDLNLSRALYASLLEAVGVVDLAKIVALYEKTGTDGHSAQPIDPERIFDLETNVVYYAQPENAAALKAKFSGGSIRDEEARPDAAGSIDEDLALLVRGFADTGKRLFFLDLTAPEIRDLGFAVVRVWSPELLGLCLPSAPPLAHPRLRVYGGGVHQGPHPYP